MADSLPEYFREVERLLGPDISAGAVIRRLIETPSSEAGSLAASISYEDGSALQVLIIARFSESFPTWRRYSFHYMDRYRQRRFRYDNVPHYHNLPHFPHHKHEGSSKRVVPCRQPSIHQIQAEIRDWLQQS